jgi:TolB-like protein/Tfp pilus assembly protein PilF
MRESLLPLAESLADGTAVDWDEAAKQAAPEDQAFVRQLGVLAKLTEIHRTLSETSEETAVPFAARRSQAAPAIGTWAHLTLLERLGGGAYGEVYRAWDRQLEREVALKLLRGVQGFKDDPETSRITREGRLLARVRHPNVITVHGVDVHEGRVGLWMELLRGQTLEQLVTTRGALSAREAALVGIDLCRALAALHAAGLLHRDVKAENVIREDGGRIVLMDLGTGREIDASGRRGLPDFAGTPLYLAPELFDGTPASEATDVYSLGILLYHLVTGSFPVWAKTVDELKRKHRTVPPIRLRDARADLPTVFVAVIDRAIAKNPAERYLTAGALEADLLKSIDDDTLPLAVPGTDAKKEASARSRHSARRRIAVIAGVVAAMVLVGGVIASLALRDRGAASVAATAPIRSIAVLPLANVSGDASQEYFADGLTDELISTLGQLRGVNVISRTSAMQFKGTTKAVREIARALNVEAVLEGTVLVATDTPGGDEKPQKRVRINERLILAGTDTQLWNRTFEHVLTDVLSLQSEIAQAVATDLHVRLAPEEQRASFAAAGGQISDAQDAYLEGRALLTNSNAATLARARQALERAVRLNPGYARAHASLSVNYVWLELVGALPRGQARTLALASARRAIELDPNLAEAHGALADVLFFYDWNRTQAEAEYRRALALNPNYSFARGQYAWYLASQGQTAEAVRQATLAADSDPLSAEAVGAVGMMLYFDRKYDDALRQLQRALALQPNGAQEHYGLARVYTLKRDFPNAIREMQEAVRLSGDAPVFVAGLARVYAAAGNAAQARAQLAGAQAADGSALAGVYAALGDRDRAFDALNRGLASRSPGMLWARVDPLLDPIRQDARFTTLFGRVGGAGR